VKSITPPPWYFYATDVIRCIPVNQQRFNTRTTRQPRDEIFSNHPPSYSTSSRLRSYVGTAGETFNRISGVCRTRLVNGKLQMFPATFPLNSYAASDGDVVKSNENSPLPCGVLTITFLHLAAKPNVKRGCFGNKNTSVFTAALGNAYTIPPPAGRLEHPKTSVSERVHTLHNVNVHVNFAGIKSRTFALHVS